MILQNDHGVSGGPLDFLCILQSVKTGRYHPCFVEEHPMPGPIPDALDTKFVCAKSKMHHTGGFVTLDEAINQIKNGLDGRLELPEKNRSIVPILWDDEQMSFTVVLPNWIADGLELSDVLLPTALDLEPIKDKLDVIK